MCALGRGIARTGRLNPDGIELASANLQRFVALARALGVDHLAIIATAAVREASDGPAFAAEAERRCGVPVRIIAGTEEARLSAAGVLAGIRGADGVVADLGGGSVELVRVDAASATPIGAGVSLPIGPLRLTELGDRSKVADFDRAQIADAPVLAAARARTCTSLAAHGGPWRGCTWSRRSTRCTSSTNTRYARPDAEGFLEIVAGQSRRSLDRIAAISRKRLEAVAGRGADPAPADRGRQDRGASCSRPSGCARVTLSACCRACPMEIRGEPDGDALIASCKGIALSQSRWSGDGDRLHRWIAPLFSGPGLPDRDAARRRLHRAACWLSDTAWSEHPDYRAAHAFARTLTLPFPQIGHAERVFLASALHARYGGGNDDPVKAATRMLLDEDEAAEARALGLALRLAYTLCGGALQLLDEVRLARDADRYRARNAADRQPVRRRDRDAAARRARPRAGRARTHAAPRRR